jgi:hypothetical protein
MKGGLITDAKAWQIPEDAFARLNNAYVSKGIVRKRFGSELMGGSALSSILDQLNSRLRVSLGSTDGAGAASGTAPGSIFRDGQQFSIGSEIFTVVEYGTPGTMISTGGSSTTKTFNTTTGAYVFAGASPSATIYYYPSLPVMGLTYYEENKVTNNTTYAFDPQFIYRFNGNSWDRDGAITLQGNNAQFFWATNWTGISDDLIALFVTNFNATVGTPAAGDDPMYVYKNSAWAEFRPVFEVKANLPDGYVQSAKIIIPFKDRLLLLNTIERDVTAGTNSEHVNRCRFSHNGTPFPADVPDNVAAAVSNAWLEGSQTWTIGGTTKKSDGAGFIDAPTEEEIEAAEFIKDRLIVYFERSTWELAYTGNQIQPFVWQKINTELGSKSLRSPVPFDKAIFAIGRTEIHGCSGANVTKINEAISDQVFELRNASEGLSRICGIREYFDELVYWSFPSVNANEFSQTYPDKVLIYNYIGDSWATADDCITAFGYYEEQQATSWESTELKWEECNFMWDSGTKQTKYRHIIAGNQQGFVFMCDSEISTNEAVLSVTNIEYVGADLRMTIIDHTLNDGDYLRLIDMDGVTLTGSGIYKVFVVDSDTLFIPGVTMTGTYEGGGRAARVSQIDILSKQWNFYVDKGKNFYLAKIDFAVLKTDAGEVTIDYYPSASQLSMIESGQATGAILGDNNLQTYPFELYPLEDSQNRLWHPVYFQTEGECVQIRIFLDDEQMRDPRISSSDLQIEGMVVHARQTSERMQ